MLSGVLAKADDQDGQEADTGLAAMGTPTPALRAAHTRASLSGRSVPTHELPAARLAPARERGYRLPFLPECEHGWGPRGMNAAANPGLAGFAHMRVHVRELPFLPEVELGESRNTVGQLPFLPESGRCGLSAQWQLPFLPEMRMRKAEGRVAPHGQAQR